MRKWLIICAAGIQVLAIVFMAAGREFILLTGRTVYLRTAPIDPRDVFRGDYVRLDYEAGHIPGSLMADSLKKRISDPGNAGRRPLKIYAVLKEDGGLGELERVTDAVPGGGLFIRGRLEEYGPGGPVRARYGIEAFFVEQKKGLDLERGRNVEGIQVPLEMEVAVGRGGAAVLKGYRWSALGMGLARETGTNRLIRAATITLKNMSSNEIAIVDLPGGASLSLENDFMRGPTDKEWSWVNAGQEPPAATDDHVRMLKPGQAHDIRVDLSDPAWFVRKDGGKPVPISELGWGPWFRLVYRPPALEDCAHLGNAGKIWRGRLLSRAFNGGGMD